MPQIAVGVVMPWPSRNQQNGAVCWLSAPPPPSSPCPEQGPARTPHLSQCPPCALWPPGIPALGLQGQEGVPDVTICGSLRWSPGVAQGGAASVKVRDPGAAGSWAGELATWTLPPAEVSHRPLCLPHFWHCLSLTLGKIFWSRAGPGFLT